MTDRPRNTIDCTVAAIVLAFATSPAVSAQAPVQPMPVPTNQVALLYDDQKLSDGERAKLFSLVADSVPFSQWRTTTVAERTDLRTLVDRFFDYYSSGPYSAPLTVDAAVEIIRTSNGMSGTAVPAGTTIRLPPLPMRAKGQFDYAREFRVYNADVQGYSAKQNAETVELPMTREMVLASSPRADPLRDATSTGIVIQVTDANMNRLTPKALPAGVMALSAVPASDSSPAKPSLVIGIVPVELLTAPHRRLPEPVCHARRIAVSRAATGACGGSNGPGCGTPAPGVDREAARHPRRRFLVAPRIQGAQGRRTSGDETGCAAAGGQNRGRRNVSGQRRGERRPDKDARRLRRVAADARGQLDRVQAPRGRSARVDRRARRQLSRSPVRGSTYTEVLLHALFAKHVKRGAVLNMSFRMRAPATARLLDEFAQDARSFSIAGISNTGREFPITPGWTPQRLRRRWRPTSST